MGEHAATAEPRPAVHGSVPVVELRVHGVSGTPPEELLERTPLVRVAGDRTAGFYRPAVAELRDDPPGAPGVPAQEPPGA
ncbi:MAG TPA: hypothetical protein VGD72_07090, partial [Mycobacteriales bacterium]